MACLYLEKLKNAAFYLLFIGPSLFSRSINTFIFSRSTLICKIYLKPVSNRGLWWASTWINECSKLLGLHSWSRMQLYNTSMFYSIANKFHSRNNFKSSRNMFFHFFTINFLYHNQCFTFNYLKPISITCLFWMMMISPDNLDLI